MGSTFAGIEIGKRSIIAHNKGLNTVGHNLSNASTEGYSRQRVIMSPSDPIYMPQLNREERPGQIGQGVDIARIERVKDEILEQRIVSKANGQGYWEARDKYILMVEQIYNEPGEYSVRSLMDNYWESWQDLSMNPSEMASRKAVIQRGETLIDGIHQRFNSLKQVRDMLDLDVNATVSKINNILSDVAGINEQIVKIEAMGDMPNDLLDRRDLLVKELSGLVNVSTDGRDPDEFTIHSGGLVLLQGRQTNLLSTDVDPQNEGYSNVVWRDSGEKVNFTGGRIASLTELRDEDVRSEIQKLDTMTINFVDLVNENHKSAYGLNQNTGMNFFVEHPFVNNVSGNYDRNGDGQFDSTYLFKISGNNTLKPQEQIGLRGTLTLAGKSGNVDIDYYPADTVQDLVSRINNSNLEVVARLDRNNKLSFRGTAAESKENPDFVLRHIEDSGDFLTGYAGLLTNKGPEGAFTMNTQDSIISLQGGSLEYSVAPLSHPSGWIEVNPALKEDPASLAAGFGENGKVANPGDGSAALAVAGLRNKPIMVGQIRTFDEYFSEVVAEVGLKGEEALFALETQNLIMKDLEDMKQSISGVNIDEELSQMIKFQHGYSAAARFISEVNKMLDTIINRMGV